MPLERIPLLLRYGALVPTVPVDAGVRNTDDLLGRPWHLTVAGPADAERDLVGFDGTVTTVRVAGDEVTADGPQPVEALRRLG